MRIVRRAVRAPRRHKGTDWLTRMDLICDLDGTVWRGGIPIAGAAAAIARARSAGHRFIFATNNSIPTPADVAEKLVAMGVPAVADDVVSSATATATLVEPGQRVFVIGGPGLKSEMAARGAIVLTPEPGTLGRELRADFVAVGRDTSFDFAALAIASDAIRFGAAFLAVCTDPTFPGPDGPEPGSGALVAAVAAASGVDPTVAGKPNAPMAAAIAGVLGGDVSNAVVIGDVVASDGELAKRLGIPFALVLSGSTKTLPPGSVGPRYLADDLAELVSVEFT